MAIRGSVLRMAVVDQHRPEDRMPDHARRFDDRDRALNQRLDTLEQESRELTIKVTSIEGTMRTVTLEQVHLKELLSARLSLIEKTQEIGNTKVETLSQNILAMASDVEKTPAGRQMLTRSQHQDAAVAELQDMIDRLKEDLAQRKLWQDRVDTVIGILKWIGAAGLVSLGYSILHVAGLVK